MKNDITDQFTYRIECQEEHIQIEGNVTASGDDAEDRMHENRVRKQLESGNQWAWCCVRVVCEFEGLETDDYLGACSYESEKDFINGSGYYEDMVANTRDAMLKNLRNLSKKIGKL